MKQTEETAIRILLIDDNEAIHKDFRSVLLPETEEDPSVLEDEAVFFGTAAPAKTKDYTIDSAYQGIEGVEKVRTACEADRPYALAFVDVRMPPGIDGIETIKRIWEVDPRMQIALCTAYSDYSWRDIITHVGETDRLLIMKKPFESIEARQIASAMSEKWKLLNALEEKVQIRTNALNERVRQLNCLYQLSDIAHGSKSAFEERLQAMVDTIPNAFDNEGLSVAQISVEDQSFTSQKITVCPETPLFSQDITVEGKKVGTVDLFSEDTHQRSQDSATQDEAFFTKAVSEQIGRLLEEKKANDAILDSNQKLQALVDELSLANEDLSNYTHAMAHDLRTPLRGIATIADWIGDALASSMDKENQEQFRQLRIRVDRMYKLIDNITCYSQLEKKQHSLVDLNRLKDEFLDTATTSTQINLIFPETLPTLKGHEASLVQLFRNILDNAIQHMDKTQGRVELSYTDEGSHWQFCIEDNGPGIDPNYHERIFKMFETLGPKEADAGTGIGLAIARRAVELHHGRIWVESELGAGARFYFTLQKDTNVPENPKEQEINLEQVSLVSPI